MALVTPTTLDALRQSIAERALSLSLAVTVPSDGNILSPLAIVGEGGGQAETDLRLPFVGESGKRLWMMLKTANFTRPDFYITNVAKRQISTARNPRNPITKDEWHAWQMLLRWELSQLPNLENILCLGNAALQALVQPSMADHGITNVRGSVYPCYIPGLEHVNVICTFNPAHILREPNNEVSMLHDIRRFSNVVSDGYKPYNITHLINPSYADAIAYIEALKHAKRPVSLDIETIGGETACFGLGNRTDEAMCIAFRNDRGSTYGIDEEYNIKRAVADLVQTTRIVAQNGNFDGTWCGYKDLIRIPIWFDTMLAHHTLYPTLPHNLGYLTSQYTHHPYYKGERDAFREGGHIDDYWRYNCKDVAITYNIHRKMLLELQQQGLEDFFFNHVMRLDPHLQQVSIDGLAVDLSVKNAIADELARDVQTHLEAFQEAARRETGWPTYSPNPSSPQQMQKLFYDILHLKGVDRSADKLQRSKWLGNTSIAPGVHDLIRKASKYIEERKFYSTYATMGVDEDGRVRYTYSQTGVANAPGRLSSSGTLWGSGTNMQNQPQRSHKFYISDPGTVMFYFDLSQAEARVVAYVADIPKWKADFERSRRDGSFDCHRSLASTMFKVPYELVPVEDWNADGVMTIRYKAKRCRHGLNYRMAFERLADVTGMSLYEARQCYIIYHIETPELKRWWQQVNLVAKRKRELWTPMGRRLKIMQKLDEQSLDSIVAFVPQSTIGDKVKQVWYQCHEDDEWDMSKMRIKLNIHDALIGIAHPKYVKTALRIAKRYAESPIMITDAWGRSTEELIIPADCKISEADDEGRHRWSTLKKVHIEL